MSVYYPSNCDDLVPDHVCDPCEEREQGRVSSIAFIKSTYAITDPSDPTQWTAGFISGDIILIPETSGTFDGGAEVMGPGFGRRVETLNGFNFQLNFKDPNYKQNCTFYNVLKNSRQYTVAYATGSQIHMVNYPVQVIPKNPVEDDVNSIVVWDVLVKWGGSDLPCPYDVPPGIFDECVYNT